MQITEQECKKGPISLGSSYNNAGYSYWHIAYDEGKYYFREVHESGLVACHASGTLNKCVDKAKELVNSCLYIIDETV